MVNAPSELGLAPRLTLAGGHRFAAARGPAIHMRCSRTRTAQVVPAYTQIQPNWAKALASVASHGSSPPSARASRLSRAQAVPAASGEGLLAAFEGRRRGRTREATITISRTNSIRCSWRPSMTYTCAVFDSRSCRSRPRRRTRSTSCSTSRRTPAVEKRLARH